MNMIILPYNSFYLKCCFYLNKKVVTLLNHILVAVFYELKKLGFVCLDCPIWRQTKCRNAFASICVHVKFINLKRVLCPESHLRGVAQTQFIWIAVKLNMEIWLLHYFIGVEMKKVNIENKKLFDQNRKGVFA